MYDRIKDKRPAEPFRLLMWAFAITAAFLLMAAPATTAAAAERQSTISGQVVAVDIYAGTLTVKPSSQNESLAGPFSFATNQMTSITSCAQNKTLKDIRSGDYVTVTYHENEGKLFADAVEKKLTLALACIYP